MEATLEQTKVAELYDLVNNRERYVEYEEVAITSAEILAMNTTPKELVAAVPGSVIEFLSAVVILDHGGTDYTTNGDLSVETGTTGTTLSDTIAGADLLLASADAVRVVQALSADAQLDPGESIVLAVGTGDPAAGNGVLRVKVAYRRHLTGL